jgi:hypothetical protein
MNINNDLTSKASQNIVDRLVWCTAQKDQAGIAKNLASGKDIPEVYGLGCCGLFDEFFFFLHTLKISNLFKVLTPNLTNRQSNIKFPTVLLIYIMRIVSGLSFFWHTEPVLLRSQPLMRLVGFNGREIREGTCRRGIKKTAKSTDDNQDGEDGGTNIRGPICTDSVATYIEAVMAHALESFFNGVISILAANSFFPKSIQSLLDASEIESTRKLYRLRKGYQREGTRAAQS